MNTTNPFPTHASPNSHASGLNNAISNNLAFANSAPNQDSLTMATANAVATTHVTPVATNATANPFLTHASPNCTAGSSRIAILNNLNVTATANTPPAISALAAVDIPDDVCKAKAHYVANNRSLKVLVVMSRGLLNEHCQPIFDEAIEPWKDLKSSEWCSDRKDLAFEIRRRWEDYIKPTVEDPDAPGPRLSSWAKPVLLEWLTSHPISELGNESTTQDVDCRFIRAELQRCKLLVIGAALERAEQQAAF